MDHKKIPLIYLASPYTHPDKKLMDRRAREVTDCSIKLLQQNIFTFCPISYNSPWSRTKWKLPHEWTFWEKFDCIFLCRCDGIAVLDLDGWEKSIGIAAELEYARRMGIPECHVSYDDIMNNNFDAINEFNSKIIKKLAKTKKAKSSPR